MRTERLSFERVGCSSAELEAANLISKEIREIGAQSRLESFPVSNVRVHKAALTALEPQIKEYSVTCFLHSGNTPRGGLIAELLPVLEVSEVSLANATGKIILLSSSHISADSYIQMRRAGVAGFITMTGSLTDGSDCDLPSPRLSPSLRQYGPIPGVNLRMSDGMSLVNSGTSKVKIEVLTESVSLPSQNIIAEIPGTEHPEEIIVIGAHYDSVEFSCGSYDNGAGCVTILELLRYFKGNPPARTLRFIWFGCEELGLLGSHAYLDTHRETNRQIRFMINVDLGAIIFGRDMACVSADRNLMIFLEYLSKETGFPIEPRFEITSSDCSSFVNAGVPAVSFCRSGLKGSEFMHSRNDCIRFQSPKALANSIRFILLFTERLVNSVVFPIPRTIPAEIKADTDRYFQNDPVSLDIT